MVIIAVAITTLAVTVLPQQFATCRDLTPLGPGVRSLQDAGELVAWYFRWSES